MSSTEDWIRNQLGSLVLASELKDKEKLKKISDEIVRSYCLASEVATNNYSTMKIGKVGGK